MIVISFFGGREGGEKGGWPHFSCVVWSMCDWRQLSCVVHEFFLIVLQYCTWPRISWCGSIMSSLGGRRGGRV